MKVLAEVIFTVGIILFLMSGFAYLDRQREIEQDKKECEMINKYSVMKTQWEHDVCLVLTIRGLVPYKGANLLQIPYIGVKKND